MLVVYVSAPSRRSQTNKTFCTGYVDRWLQYTGTAFSWSVLVYGYAMQRRLGQMASLTMSVIR